VRQSGATHEESIKSNKEIYCFEKDSGFQQPNDAAAVLFTGYIRDNGSEDIVVELGCGDGASLRKFQELGVFTIGVDINPSKLALATGPVYEMDMLEFLKVQQTGSANNIFMHHSLEHIVAVKEVLAEVPRVLKKGGLFFCITPAEDEPHSVHNTAFDSPDELEPSGLKRLECTKQIRFGHPEYMYVGIKEVDNTVAT
jgi:SAM-dependent methyltransferase